MLGTLFLLFLLHTPRLDDHHQKGVLVNIPNPESMPELRFIPVMGEISLALPNCLASMHVCLMRHRVTEAFSVFWQLFLRTMGPHFRARCKINIGSATEWKYQLMSYGIPQDLIPITDNGQLKNRKGFLECLEMRIKGEELVRRYNQQHNLPFVGSSPIPYVVYPTRTDVLLGKENPINKAAGNRMLHEIVDDHLEQYHQAGTSRKEKQQVLRTIYDCVTERGGRFLSKEEHGVWLALDFDAAKDKIFRTLHHRHKKSDKQKTTQQANKVKVVGSRGSKKQRSSCQVDGAQMLIPGGTE